MCKWWLICRQNDQVIHTPLYPREESGPPQLPLLKYMNNPKVDFVLTEIQDFH